jgi:hypothetical protein
MSYKEENSDKEVPALQLVKSDVQKIEKPEGDGQTSLFIRRMIHHPDDKIAAEMIQKQASLEADEMYGSELTRLKLLRDDLDARYKSSNEILTELEKRKAQTYRHVKRANKSNNDDFKDLM